MFLIAALILLAIIFVAKIASKWRVPLVVVSLFAGMLFGDDILKIVHFHDYAYARRIADYALVFVLFIGGFGTKKERLKMVLGPAMVLATVGVMMTAGLTVGTLVFLSKFLLPQAIPTQQAILIGCIIASTDAAAVFSILRSRSLNPKLSSVVEIESATNDPMAIILTTIAVQLTVAQAASQLEQPVNLILYLMWQIAGGVGIGLLIGWVMVFVSRFVAELDKGYYYIYIISIIMLSYGAAETAKASGILSAFFAGFVLGNSDIPYKSTSSTLLDALSTIGNVVIFVLLGLLVSPSGFRDVFMDGILLFLILTLVARPITVAACTFFAKYSLKENVFLSWSGLRGAVPIVLATYPAAAGIDDTKYIFNVVFFAVLLSMLVQGGTITKLADKLKLAYKARPKPRQVMELVSMHNSGMELVEIDVDDEVYSGSEFVSSFRLPAGTTITMVNRNDKIIAPTGQTRIIAGDMIYVLVKTGEVENVTSEILRHFKSDSGDTQALPDYKDVESLR